MPEPIDYEALRKWATPTQNTYIDAIIKYGSNRTAAKHLGVYSTSVDKAISALRRRAAMAGYAPAHDMTRTVPSPFEVRGVSTYYNKEGKAAGQWVKSRLNPDNAEEAIREFIEELAQGARGMSPIPPPNPPTNDDLLCVYPMGDPHYGMYAWKDETGADFDLNIAESLTRGAIDSLVASAPSAGTGLLLNLGDFFHMDSSENTTTRGTRQDVDTRWAKVMQVGLRSMVYCITKLLTKHAKVVVRNVAGNHDTHSSFALALALDAYFANNPAVTIDLSPAEHWYYRFGDTLIGSTHGDKTKPAALPGVMATDMREAWGGAKHCYWYCGHIHHSQVLEFPGVIVEFFRTLASRDAWHSGQGYRSGRDMRCIVLHRRHGEIARNRCDVGML